MKKLLIVSFVTAVISITASLFIFIILSLRTGEWFPGKAELKWKNAPAQTEYIDILLRLDNEDYVNSTEPPKWYINKYTNENGERDFTYSYLPINKNSEIVKLNTDGYVSLSSHYKYFENLIIYGNEQQIDNEWTDAPPALHISGDVYDSPDFESLYKKYKNFKAVYVNKNGEVLGITDSFDVSYNPFESYTITADGNELTLNIPKDHPAIVVLFYVLCVLTPLSVLIFLISAIIYFTNKSKKKFSV